MMKIELLSATIGSKQVVDGVTLSIDPGTIHMLIGPNGSGKSSLANILAGHPDYTVSSGTVRFDKADILGLAPEERARLGIFLAFQHPVSIPGVPVSQFIRLSLAACGKSLDTHTAYIKELRKHMSEVGLPAATATRAIHVGMSGGEQKRLELLQLRMHKPKLAILDEIDSGLDIDGLRLVGETVSQMKPHTAFVIITHNPRLIAYVQPDYVHVIKNGSIVRSGTDELLREVEEHGYANF